MTTKYLPRAITVVLLYSVFELIGFQELHAQVYGPQEVKWLWVGSLRHWFSSACAEIEYAQRAPATVLVPIAPQAVDAPDGSV